MFNKIRRINQVETVKKKITLNNLGQKFRAKTLLHDDLEIENKKTHNPYLQGRNCYQQRIRVKQGHDPDFKNMGWNPTIQLR